MEGASPVPSAWGSAGQCYQHHLFSRLTDTPLGQVFGNLQRAGRGSRVTFQVDIDALPLQEGALCRARLGSAAWPRLWARSGLSTCSNSHPLWFPFSLQSQWGGREMDFWLFYTF